MRLLWLLALSAIALCSKAAEIIVCDASDSLHVACASVISSKGIIIGLTDNSGKIAVRPSDFPLSVRSMGYEAATMGEYCDTVFLKPATYILPELVISPADRPVTRVLAYAREYCTGATTQDTLQLYTEYMLEFFFADGKVKGYSKSDRTATQRRARRYGRISKADETDSVMRPKYSDDISTLSFLESMAFMPYETEKETERMQDGALTDTIEGKYGPKFVYRKNGRLFVKECDALSDYKNHVCSLWFFKLLGMTMEMQEAKWSLAYAANDSGKYGLTGFIYGTYNFHVLGKGKLLKKMIGVKEEIGIDCYIELYPVSIERLTVADYKEAKKDREHKREDFRAPANLQPLPAAIEALVNRIDSELPLRQ